MQRSFLVTILVFLLLSGCRTRLGSTTNGNRLAQLYAPQPNELPASGAVAEDDLPRVRATDLPGSHDESHTSSAIAASSGENLVTQNRDQHDTNSSIAEYGADAAQIPPPNAAFARREPSTGETVASYEEVEHSRELDSTSDRALDTTFLSQAVQEQDIPSVSPQNPLDDAPEPGEDDLSQILIRDGTVPDELDVVHLGDVINSVYRAYPSLQAALYQFQQADAALLAANGAFDTSLKASTENGPVGFYETYRHSIGMSQPLYSGGEVFAGYRTGRGSFQPWYLERQTNDGGEFKAGVALPLLQNTDIDYRRAHLWRAEIARQQVTPDVQAQLIGFVQAGSDSYWKWVATGHKLQIYYRVYQLAARRQQGLERKRELGDIDPPVAADNRRLILSRESQYLEARRVFQEAAIKLSLYMRDSSGHPIVLGLESLPDFPDVERLPASQVTTDIQLALSSRPELTALSLTRRQLEIEYRQAQNTFLPKLDLVVAGSQDVGQPTSSKRDKSPFELEVGVFGQMPLQRRNARGKMLTIQAKMAQLNQKMQLVQDTIAADVQRAYAAVIAEYDQVALNREAVGIAESLASIERRKFEVGEGDLLSVILREQYAAETAIYEIDALLRYFQAQADYRASLGTDRLQ